MEQLLETTVELALEGNVTSKGMPKPMHLALFVAAVPPRGQGAVPAGLDGARPDGAAGCASRAGAATPSATPVPAAA